MKRFMGQMLICILISLLVTIPRVAQTLAQTQTDETVAAWQEDLAHLRERMESIHPNLFWRISEESLDEMFTALDAELATLTDDQIKVRLLQILATIDGHTQIFPLQDSFNFRMYPIRLYSFSNGLFVIDAQPPYEDLIGAELIRVHETETEAAYAILETLAPHDNAMTRRMLTPLYFVIPEILHSLNLINDINAPRFTFALADTTEQTVDLPVQSVESYRAWAMQLVGLPVREEPLTLTHRTDPFWHTYLEAQDTLFVQYNLVERSNNERTSLISFADEINDFIETTPPTRVIVDMRHNPGGNNTTYRPFLNLLSNHDYFQEPDRLFVIIGRQTFSAATNFVTELEGLNPNVIFVGEPTGGSPNLYGDTRPITLPNSGIIAQVSGRYWQKSTPDDVRDALAPQIAVEMSSSDFFSGRDPVLEAIFAFQP